MDEGWSIWEGLPTRGASSLILFKCLVCDDDEGAA